MDRPTAPVPESGRPLSGLRVAVPECRQGDLLSGMLTRAGAEVLACPLVGIHDAPDQAPVEAWLRELAAGRLDDIVFFTGEGVRRLLAAAERCGLKPQAVAALGRVRKFARGNKPVRALIEVGLREEVLVEPPTTAGVIAALTPLDLAGRRVGVQLYGSEPNLPLMEFLAGKKAAVRPVAPYAYADAAEDAAVAGLLDALERGGLQAIAFTSAAQWRRLASFAREHGREAALHAALAKVVVAAVGPNVHEKLAADGVRVDCQPSGEEYFMSPLVRALGRHARR